MTPLTKLKKLRVWNFTIFLCSATKISRILLFHRLVIKARASPGVLPQRSRAVQQHKARCNICVLRNIEVRPIGSLNVDLFLGLTYNFECPLT